MYPNQARSFHPSKRCVLPRIVLKLERAAVRGLIVFDNPQVGRRHAIVAAGMSTDKVNLRSCMLIVPAPKRGERCSRHTGSRMVTVAENDQPVRACPRTQRREPVQVAVRRSHWLSVVPIGSGTVHPCNARVGFRCIKPSFMLEVLLLNRDTSCLH